jgi:hypothetical protein
LEVGDHVKFRTQVGRLTNAFVVFNSAGGNLLAGIEIGKTIRLKSFATAVLDGLRCEPLRVCRRLQLLRRWSHEQADKQQVLA